MVEVASLLAAEETSEMFWGSLEAPQALSKETASVPARAALMTFFFMCIPLEKKIMYVCRSFAPTGRSKSGRGAKTEQHCVAYPALAAGTRLRQAAGNQNKKA